MSPSNVSVKGPTDVRPAAGSSGGQGETAGMSQMRGEQKKSTRERAQAGR